MSSSSNIRISYAYDSDTDSLISIAKALKGRAYQCPECRAVLKKRAGEYRREHFYHPRDSKCSISEETSLHFGAKLFLKECLVENKPVEISFPTCILPENEFKSLLAKEEIEKIQIPVRRFLPDPLIIHKNECGIDGSSFKADVISKNPQREIVMIWEILVSHAIDQDKRRWLNENGLPYLELKPAEKGFDEFSFEVASFGNLSCLKPETFKLASLIDIYQNELHGPFAERFLRYFLDNIEELVFDQLISNMSNSMIPSDYDLSCHVEDVNKFFKEHESFEIWQTYFKGQKLEEFSYVPLKDIKLEESKYGPAPKFNGRYYADSKLNLCGETFIKFAERFAGMMGRVDANGRLRSISTSVFFKDFTKVRIEIGDEEFECLEMANLQFLVFDNSNPKDPHYRIQMPDENMDAGFAKQPRLDFPADLFVDFLKDLITIAKIDLIVGMPSKANYEYVYGLRITGIYSIKAFNLGMRKAVFDSLKQIFFCPPPRTTGD